MRIYKIIKKIVKSVLYNLPKSFLVWFILFLLYILLSGSNVKASTVSESDLSYLDFVNISGTSWQSSYIPTQNTEFVLECNVSEIGKYTYLLYSGVPSDEIFQNDRDIFFSFVLINPSPCISIHMKNTEVLKTTDFPFGRMTISYYGGVVQVNDIIYTRISSDYWFYENIYPMSFNDRLTSDFDYKIIRFTVKNNTNGSVLYDYYPVKIGDSVGMYDLVNKNYEEISGAVAGSIISSPNIDYNQNSNTEQNTTIDYTDNIQNVQNSVDKMQETQQETNEFLKNDTINDSNFNLPSIEIEDPTANFFDTLFVGLYNAFTSTENKTISFKIFNTEININSSDFNFLNLEEFNLLRFLLEIFWVVGIGMFILKDIRRMIEKLKNGDIDNIANNDIKADMV